MVCQYGRMSENSLYKLMSKNTLLKSYKRLKV